LHHRVADQTEMLGSGLVLDWSNLRSNTEILSKMKDKTEYLSSLQKFMQNSPKTKVSAKHLVWSFYLNHSLILTLFTNWTCRINAQGGPCIILAISAAHLHYKYWWFNSLCIWCFRSFVTKHRFRQAKVCKQFFWYFLLMNF